MPNGVQARELDLEMLARGFSVLRGLNYASALLFMKWFLEVWGVPV